MRVSCETQVSSGQSLASRPEAKSTCDLSNGVYEAGWSEDTGRAIEPRNFYGRGHKDKPLGNQRGKPTVLLGWKAAVLYGRYGKSIGHHRGLRTGHVFMGVTRELGRAYSLLVGKWPEDEEYRLETRDPALKRLLLPPSASHEQGGTQTEMETTRYRRANEK